MISAFSSANEQVDELIKELIKDVTRTEADDPKFMPLIDAIAKLRASKNKPTIKEAS